MAKIKTIGLTRYVTNVLLLAFSGIVAILLVALVSFQLLISSGKIAPANAGETEARAEVVKLKESQSFPDKLTPKFYDYIHFAENGTVKSASVSGDALKKTIKDYKDRNDSYSTAACVIFSDGTYALLFWQYKAQFTNDALRKLFPNFEILFFIGITIVLLLFFSLFVRRTSKQLKAKLILVEKASQQIAQRELDSDIKTETGIVEFGHVLQSIDDMRGALKESLMQQWETQQQRKQEIAALTHDINTPLTVINGNAELLLEDQLGNEQRQLIENIHDSGIKTKQYIELLQQISNFDVIQEEKVAVSLESIMEELTKTLSPLAKQKKITLTVRNESAVKTILVAPVMLMRALVNIGENAIRFTDSGDVTIKVQQAEQKIVFIVEDNGPGFSGEAILHAKEMFWQQDQSRTSDHNYGIGLSIVDRVAKFHNGQLKLENTHVGGRVTLILPIDK